MLNDTRAVNTEMLVKFQEFLARATVSYPSIPHVILGVGIDHEVDAKVESLFPIDASSGIIYGTFDVSIKSSIHFSFAIYRYPHDQPQIDIIAITYN